MNKNRNKNKTKIYFLLIVVFIMTMFSSSAFAAAISAYGRISTTAISANYGTTTFWRRVNYTANAFSGVEAGKVYEAVNDHDVQCYKLTEDGIKPPEIGNGSASFIRVEMLNSNNSVVSSLGGSLFTSCTRGHIWPGGTILWYDRFSSNWLQNYASDNYKVRVVSQFWIGSEWVPSGATDNVLSGTF